MKLIKGQMLEELLKDIAERLFPASGQYAVSSHIRADNWALRRVQSSCGGEGVL